MFSHFAKNSVSITTFVNFWYPEAADWRLLLGLPWWLSGWESTPQHRRHGFDPWSKMSPRAITTQVLMPLSPWFATREATPMCSPCSSEKPRTAKKYINKNTKEKKKRAYSLIENKNSKLQICRHQRINEGRWVGRGIWENSSSPSIHYWIYYM